MNLKPDNAVQFFIDVQKASGKDSPHHPDFYKVALDRGNEPLVKALASINDDDLINPEAAIKNLNEKYFLKTQDKSKAKSWVDRVSNNRSDKKSRLMNHTS